MSKTESEEFRCGARMVEIIKLEPLQHIMLGPCYLVTQEVQEALYISRQFAD